MKKQLLKKGIKLLFLGMALAGNAMAQNLLNNSPSFEDYDTATPDATNPTYRWYRGGTNANTLITRTVDGTAQDGTAYLKAVTPSSGYTDHYMLQAVNYQNITDAAYPNNSLVVGKTYKLSFYYKNTAGHSFKAGVENNNGTAPNTYFATITATASSWTLFEYTFIAGSDLTTTGNIKVKFQFGKDAGTTMIDNVQLTNVVVATGGTNIVTNGNLETSNGGDGFLNWARSNMYSSTMLAQSGVAAQEGSRYARIDVPTVSGAQAWDIQFASDNFTLVPGHQYQLKFYYKSNKEFNWNIQDPSFSTISSGAITVTTNTSTWTEVQSLFTVAAGKTQGSLKFHFNIGATGFVELDNLSIIDLTALPVTLSSFSAKANLNSIAVNWKTETETNASHFELLRAGEDGTFKYLTKVSAKNTGSNYSFTDVNPLKGKNYYKLLQYDLDGKINEIKEVASAKFELSNTELALYPNPTTGKFNFNLNNYAGRTINIQLTDIIGKTLKTDTLSAVEGINTVSLPQALNAGLYFVKISGQNLLQTSKLLIK